MGSILPKLSGGCCSRRAAPTVSTQPVVSRTLTRELALQSLREIDEADTGTVTEKIDALFDKYAYGNSDRLEGESYKECIADLVQHVLREASQRVENHGGLGTVPPEEVTKAWVISTVDPNGDGVITREEARVGFRMVVDDIEFGAELDMKRRASSKNSTVSDKPSRAEQIEALACCQGISLPSDAAAILVFGSGWPELPRHLCELLADNSWLCSLPLLLTGTNEEVDALTTALGDHNLNIDLDTTARTTHDNANWAAQKLSEKGLMRKPIIFVAFPVLARGGIDALKFWRVPRFFIHPVFPASKIDVDDPSILDSWVQQKYDAIGKTWSGKP